VTTATVTVSLDLSGIEEAITDAVEAGDYSGLGADGDSVYEVSNADAVQSDGSDTLDFSLTVTWERESGKFASKDELIEALAEALSSETLEIALEVQQ
jgi:hypothetical protein